MACRASNLSMYSVEKPSSAIEPRSPPEPLTHSTCTCWPVSGSACQLLGEGVGWTDMGGGVAAAVIGDAQIRAQQVRAVQQQPRSIERGSMVGIPTREV